MKRNSLFLAATLPMALCAKEIQKPNVVFVYADDMGKGMLSHYGQKYISTPNIDRLFAEGTAFENAYGCMFSAPARASMFTGYSDYRNNKWHIENGALFKTDKIEEVIDSVENKINSRDVKLSGNDYILPQIFKKAGYVTGEIGKLEWGFTVSRQQMKEHGWDYYYGYLDHVRCHGYYPPFLFENGNIVRIDGNTHVDCAKAFEKETPETYKKRWNMDGKAVYSQNLFVEKAIQFIRENKDKPFFLYHPTQLPHGPVAIPEVHPEVKNNKKLSELEKEYASMVKMLDDHIGVMLNELEKLNLLDNTIFIFSVDNGHETYYTVDNRCMKAPARDMNGKKFDDWNYPYTSERTGDLFNGNAGMTGKKWSNWEGGVKVPLVFRWKDKIKAGYTTNQLVSNYDLVSTFADMLGVELSSEKDGVSYLPVLLGQKESLPMRYVVLDSKIGPAVVSSDGWKLVFNKRKKESHLYYLPEDRNEQKNLYGKHPDIEKRLFAQIKNIESDNKK